MKNTVLVVALTVGLGGCMTTGEVASQRGMPPTMLSKDRVVTKMVKPKKKRRVVTPDPVIEEPPPIVIQSPPQSPAIPPVVKPVPKRHWYDWFLFWRR